MNKVITINLSGRSYSVEEPGYNQLKAYLDSAATRLDGNPDKEEIMKDFNLAIAEKCDTYLNAGKNVITAAEIENIIKDMGPVEGSENSSSGSTSDSGKTNDNGSNTEGRHKKLYLIHEGAVIFGVCNGLASYFNIDVTLMRVIFIGLTILSHGAWILVYFIMAMVIPKATTPAEKAEAFGTSRMTAQELIERAKNGYDNFRNSKEWKKWKGQMKEERRRWKYEQQRYNRPSAFYELAQSIIGMAWTAFIVYLFWLGYMHVPAIHDLLDTIGLVLQHLVERLTDVIKTKLG